MPSLLLILFGILFSAEDSVAKIINVPGEQASIQAGINAASWR